jgi:tetratricopeptide (TPR) repeat protein
MSTYRRIYKKKLKESVKIDNLTTQILNYVRKNLRFLIFISLIVLISVSGWAGFIIYKGNIDEKIKKEIYFIQKESVNLKEISLEKIEKLKKLDKSYLKKNNLINLYLGHFYYKNAKFEDAVNEYKKVLESKSSPLLKEVALTGLGYSYEALGRYKDAVNTFNEILNNQDEKNLLNKEELYISLGRFYEELGDNKSALEKYQFVADKFPYIQNFEEIKEKIKRLK